MNVSQIPLLGVFGIFLIIFWSLSPSFSLVLPLIAIIFLGSSFFSLDFIKNFLGDNLNILSQGFFKNQSFKKLLDSLKIENFLNYPFFSGKTEEGSLARLQNLLGTSMSLFYNFSLSITEFSVSFLYEVSKVLKYFLVKIIDLVINLFSLVVELSFKLVLSPWGILTIILIIIFPAQFYQLIGLIKDKAGILLTKSKILEISPNFDYYKELIQSSFKKVSKEIPNLNNLTNIKPIVKNVFETPLY